MNQCMASATLPQPSEVGASVPNGPALFAGIHHGVQPGELKRGPHAAVPPSTKPSGGFSPLAVTFVFGIYAAALLAALLITGRLSDYVGRRPVLIAATRDPGGDDGAFSHFADGLATLIAARVIQGLSTGAAISAVGGGNDGCRQSARRGRQLGRRRRLVTALGAVLAGLMVHYPAGAHAPRLFHPGCNLLSRK